MNSSTRNFDLVVIGSGPAGQKGALTAAAFGKSVAIVERKWSGRSSDRAGMISARLLREAVASLRSSQKVTGKNVSPSHQMPDLHDRIRSVVTHHHEAVKAQLQRSGITLLEGDATFSAANTLTITNDAGSETIGADKFLITVGVHPAPSNRFPEDGIRVLSLDQLLSRKIIPHHLIMAGAGLTGIEYASMMAHLGAKVTITDPRSTVLNFVDDEIVAAFTRQLTSIGVEFRLGVTVTNCNAEGESVTVTLSDGKQLVGDAVIDVTGYHGNTASLALEKAGVSAGEDGKLEVNERFQTRNPNIYAAGDVIGFPIEGLYYGSISMEQARLAVCNMFSRPAASNPECYPYAIYAMPEIAMVGQTEQSLKREGIDYQVGVARYEELVKAQIAGEKGLLKLLFDPDTLHLLGVHVLGAGAAEVIHVGQAVLRYGGTIEYLRENVFNYPTIAEAYHLAAVDGLRKVGWLPAARSTAAG